MVAVTLVADLAQYARASAHLQPQTQVLSLAKSEGTNHATVVIVLQSEWLLFNELELTTDENSALSAKSLNLNGTTFFLRAPSSKVTIKGEQIQ